MHSLIASNHLDFDEKKLSTWSEDVLKLYIQILLSATLDRYFPADKYKHFNFVKESIDKMMSGKKNDYLEVIKKLKNFLKWKRKEKINFAKSSNDWFIIS